LRFEEVSEALRLVRRAVEHGCRAHYDKRQREAVYESYAGHLFLDALGPLETVVAEETFAPREPDEREPSPRGERLVGLAQLDPREGRLRALFVDATQQQRGIGRILLDEIEARARHHRLRLLHGAMSLNAVPFYLRAGFRPTTDVLPLRSNTVTIPVLPMEKTLSLATGPRHVV